MARSASETSDDDFFHLDRDFSPCAHMAKRSVSVKIAWFCSRVQVEYTLKEDIL